MNPDAPLLRDARKAAEATPQEQGILQEFYLTQTRERSVSWADGKLDMEHHGTQQGLTVRLLREGQQAMASTHDFSSSSVQATWTAARAALDFSQKDPHAAFAEKAVSCSKPFSLDKNLFKKSGDEVKESLREFESKIKAFDSRLSKVIRMGFSEALQEWALINSNGVEISEASTESSFGLEVLATEAGRSEVAGRYEARRFSEDLTPQALIDQICEEAVQALGAKTVPSGDTPTVFDPWVGAQFLELVAHALCADQVQKGKSFMESPEGQSVTSSLVTLTDDGLLNRGLNSSVYDDEGSPRGTTVLVKAGKLQHLLYDVTSARRDKISSTGNGGRIGFSRPPCPSPSNFYLSAGPASPDELIKSTGRGFLVQEVMGMHTADPISGDFSVGAQGRWIEGGKLSHGVRGVTLAGNLKKLLTQIDAVANDLTWYGSIGTPTFRVSQLTIGGS